MIHIITNIICDKRVFLSVHISHKFFTIFCCSIMYWVSICYKNSSYILHYLSHGFSNPVSQNYTYYIHGVYSHTMLLHSSWTGNWQLDIWLPCSHSPSANVSFATFAGITGWTYKYTQRKTACILSCYIKHTIRLGREMFFWGMLHLAHDSKLSVVLLETGSGICLWVILTLVPSLAAALTWVNLQSSPASQPQLFYSDSVC